MADRNILIVDTETTGLNPYADEIIEIAALRMDRRATEELGRFYAKIRPTVNVPPDVVAVNGYNDADWCEALCTPEKEVASQLAAITDGVILVGANPRFDAAFMERLLLKYGLTPKWHYRLIDVCSMAWPDVVDTGQASLNDLAEFYRVPGRTGMHDAATDVAITLGVYRKILARVTQ